MKLSIIVVACNREFAISHMWVYFRGFKRWSNPRPFDF